jgi:hypothetical protein
MASMESSPSVEVQVPVVLAVTSILSLLSLLLNTMEALVAVAQVWKTESRTSMR